MCLKYVQAPPPNSALAGKNAKIAKNLVFPLNLNRVMVFKHILHQPTRYTIFPNDKLCGFNSLEHNSERTLFRGSIKCLKKYCRKYWILT